jgi:hypothetical protein
VPLPKNAQELEQVFTAFLQGENIKQVCFAVDFVFARVGFSALFSDALQAEAILKAFVKKADCVGALMQQLVSSNQVGMSIFCSICIRCRARGSAWVIAAFHRTPCLYAL